MSAYEISVILPTFNRGHLLERAIDSVVGQTLAAVEIIVVDDGSDDETADVVKRLQAEHANLVYCYVERGGAARARNTGLRIARSRFIAFQDSDDEWDKDFLKILMTVASSTGAGVVFASHRLVELDGTETLIPHGQMREVTRSLLRRNFISTQTVLMDRKALPFFEFDAAMPRLQDWDLWLTLLPAAEFVHVATPLATLYRQSDSLSASHSRYATAIRRLVRKHWRLFARRPGILARHTLSGLTGGKSEAVFACIRTSFGCVIVRNRR